MCTHRHEYFILMQRESARDIEMRIQEHHYMVRLLNFTALHSHLPILFQVVAGEDQLVDQTGLQLEEVEEIVHLDDPIPVRVHFPKERNIFFYLKVR